MQWAAFGSMEQDIESEGDEEDVWEGIRPWSSNKVPEKEKKLDEDEEKKTEESAPVKESV